MKLLLSNAVKIILRRYHHLESMPIGSERNLDVLSLLCFKVTEREDNCRKPFFDDDGEESALVTSWQQVYKVLFKGHDCKEQNSSIEVQA